jgi:3'-phosphoadenosine 5'-phosphosulfate sulfotransferase (PAPS reductase)/FAD synthetase
MTRHILSLSGGKDSAALAVYLRDRVPDMEYIFHDTGKELPETYDYMARLESILGRPVTRTTSEDTFEHWLAVYGDMLPSNHRRWCTKMLKLKPFENYIGDDQLRRAPGRREPHRIHQHETEHHGRLSISG